MCPIRGGILLVVAAAAGLGGGCGNQPDPAIPDPGPLTSEWIQMPLPERPWNLVVITLDTTRRDRLGCYGHSGGLTPNLDMLAKRGILFEEAVTPVPITLPAHATLFIGQNPQVHGVRNNTTFRLPEEARTLAEFLREDGYATGATLGAAPVEAGFGLEQGFDHYDDAFPVKTTLRTGKRPERRATEVTTAGLAWIAEHATEPFFHWLHYFDPHHPYEPPPPFDTRHRLAYDGEIAYMDDQVGRLITGLDELDLMGRTWVLCVADHGESLGEHGEETHAYLIYGATQRVPCLLVPPKGMGAGIQHDGLHDEAVRGRRVAEIVSLRDLGTTVLNALGWSQVRLGDGRSLLPLVAGEKSTPQVVYTETLAPFLDLGWTPLRGVRTERWSYIRAPEPELYDLRSDPVEARNLHERRPAVAGQLAAWCDYYAALDQGYQTQTPSAESVERLRSLGYVGAPAVSSAAFPDDKDPKHRMGLLTRTMSANGLLDQDPEAAIDLLRSVLRADPGNPMALRLLARACIRVRDWQSASEACGALLAQMPGDLEMQSVLGLSQMMRGHEVEAESLLSGVLAADPDDLFTRTHYAVLLTRRGRTEEARSILEDTVARFPGVAEPLTELAIFEWNRGNTERAVALAEEALELHERQAPAWALRGEALLREAGEHARRGEVDQAAARREQAEAYYRHALEIDPGEPIAAERLAALAAAGGETGAAIASYERLLERRANDPALHVALGNLYRQTRQYDSAAEHYAAAYERGYREPRFLSNFGVLQILQDRPERARKLWEEALAQRPDPELVVGIRQNLERLEAR